MLDDSSGVRLDHRRLDSTWILYGRDITIMILSKLLQKRSLQHPSESLLNALTNGEKTSSGVTINETNALQITAVWACVRVISETIASLPLFVYERIGTGQERKVSRDHPVNRILHEESSADISAMGFQETMMIYVLTWGNGYAKIVRNGRDDPEELQIILPSSVRVTRRADGSIIYEISNDPLFRNVQLVQSRDMLHIAGPSLDGIVGMSPVQMAREAMGLARASETYGASIFGNNSRPSGVLEHPGKMDEESHSRLKSSWEKNYKGISNAGKTAVLEDGVKFNAISFPPEDAQMLETRQFQTEEIARWFNVPPHKIQHLLRATFSNIDSQQISFATDTIRPWLVRWEQEYRRKLFIDDDRFFAEYSLDALLRGDPKLRSESLQIQFMNGAINQNEWRGLENRPNIGDDGDRFYRPANLIAVDIEGADGTDANLPLPVLLESEPDPESEPDTESDPDEEENSRRSLIHMILQAHRPILADAIRRSLQVEISRVLRGKRLQTDFGKWLSEFYSEHAKHVRGSIIPAVDAAIDSVLASTGQSCRTTAMDEKAACITESLANKHVSESLRNIEGGLPAAIEYWKDGRADDEAGLAMFDIVKLLQGN